MAFLIIEVGQDIAQLLQGNRLAHGFQFTITCPLSQSEPGLLICLLPANLGTQIYRNQAKKEQARL